MNDLKKKSELDFEEFLPTNDNCLMAFADPDGPAELLRRFSMDGLAAQSMREQAEALQDQLGKLKDRSGVFTFEFTPQQAEEFRKQAEQFRDAFKDQNFGIDQKQLDGLHRQMEQFNKDFGVDGFKFDPKQMDELKQQMQEFQRQMEDLKSLEFGHMV